MPRGQETQGTLVLGLERLPDLCRLHSCQGGLELLQMAPPVLQAGHTSWSWRGWLSSPLTKTLCNCQLSLLHRAAFIRDGLLQICTFVGQLLEPLAPVAE
eukprot:2678366-Pyramimonas_sp.AAC.1